MGALLFILKIVGYILAAFLLIFFIVLLVPVRYRLAAEAGNGKKSGGMVWVSWLFGIIRVCFDFESKQVKLKILFFDLSKIIAGSKGEQTSPEEIKRDREENSMEERPEEDEEPEPREKTEKKKVKKPKKKKSGKKDEKGILSKIKEMLSFAEKIYGYPDKGKVIRLTITLLKRLYRAIKPKQFKLDALAGFDDPSLTGYLLGAVGVVRGITLWDLRVTGDFEQKILRATLNVKGRIIAGAVLWPLLIYALFMWKHVKIFLKWRNEYGQ